MSGELPWISGDLTITREVLSELEAHALSTYPSECCGFVSGPASEPLSLDGSQREVNEADKYHKLDPETFPRTSRDYFKINELRAGRAFDEGDQGHLSLASRCWRVFLARGRRHVRLAKPADVAVRVHRAQRARQEDRRDEAVGARAG
jgi:hypothetical protein